MFKTRRSKVIGAFLAVGLFTILVYGQLGPTLRFPVGSESQPGLHGFRDTSIGFYIVGDGIMGFGFEDMVFEGATADASEATIRVEDPTADTVFLFNTDKVDTYDVLMVPDQDAAKATLVNPMWGWTAGAPVPVDATIADLQGYVQRIYVPSPMVLGAVYGINEAGSDTASSNGDLGAALYEDADDGVQLFICAVADPGGDGAIDCDGTDVTLQAGWYRLLLCGEDVSDEMWGGALQVSSLLATTWNTFGLNSLIIGESANDCTTVGIPPATTGALEDSATEVAFWVLGPDN